MNSNWGNNKYLGKDYPYICLDILKDYTAGVPYAGWSSAYDISTILAQLTSFLFAENIPQEYGGSIKARLLQYHFHGHGHRGHGRSII